MTELVETPTPSPGGWHVKDAADGEHCIDVLQMMYGYRVVLADKRPGHREHWLLDGAWCYFGSGVDENGQQRCMMQAMVNATLAAEAWDGSGEPPGYDKVAGT
jgi:hypothetical protein